MVCIECGEMNPFPSKLIRPKIPAKILRGCNFIATVAVLKMGKSQWLFATNAEYGFTRAANQSLMLYLKDRAGFVAIVFNEF